MRCRLSWIAVLFDELHPCCLKAPLIAGRRQVKERDDDEGEGLVVTQRAVRVAALMLAMPSIAR